MDQVGNIGMNFVLSADGLMDITRPLSRETPVWPGDQQFIRESSSEGGFVSSRICMSSHSGTHMDAPSHLADLSRGIDEIPFHQLICTAVVVDCSMDSHVTEQTIGRLYLEGRALLLKTEHRENMSLQEKEYYSTLSDDAAERAVKMGISLLGTDARSVDQPDCSSIHRIILGSHIPIVENLMLSSIPPGEYLLICLPMLVEQGDGAPVRAFLYPGAP